ncbi:MAG: PASTA domain-containing protein [Nitrospiraceae bacterium]|nr:PASTA domain-containing protein [Nitrospiraceae bacterium]
MNSLIKIPLFFAAFVLLGLVFGFLTFNILSFSRTVEVPSVASLTLREADDSLSKAGLYLKIEGEDFDASVPAGRILRQDIPAGNKVKERRPIKVVVSKGPRINSIPSIVNETLQNAEAALMQKGLKIGKVVKVHSDTVEKGKIVAQRPEPDERLTDVITALVSAGPHEVTYYCPDFQGKTLESAKELAGKMGLSVETKGPGEIVRSQKPKPGALIRGGDAVYLETKEASSND